MGEEMKNCISIILSKTNYNQNKLAQKVGLSRTTINRIISGEINPSLRKAFAIAHVLGARVDEIFFPTEKEMFEENNKCS